MTAIPDFSIRMQVAGMRGLLSEIIAVGALSKHGDTDLMERVREAADTPLPELPTRSCLAQIEEPAGAAPAAVAPQGEYPPLPEGVMFIEQIGGDVIARPTEYAYFKNARGVVHGAQLFTADQLRAYFDLGRQPATVEVPAIDLAEVELPDVEDMAHSAVQEALSFGVHHDVFHRWMRAVMDKTVEAMTAEPVAAPALEAPAAPAVPPGFALVPIEPTQQMLDAGRRSGAGSVSIQEEWARKEVWSRMLATITPPPAAYTDDLVALVENLAQALSAAAPGNDLAGHALDYLKRNGLQGSPLQAAEAAPQAPNCTRCSGSGEDPEGYLTHGRGPDDQTVDGPCRECDGTGAAPQAPAAPYAWHYWNSGGASVYHRGDSKQLDADKAAAGDHPKTHHCIPLYTNPAAPAAPAVDALDADRWRALEGQMDAGRVSLTVHHTEAEQWDGRTISDAGEMQDYADSLAAQAAPAAPAVDAWLQPDDMAALQRFHETAEDDESYDIGKEAVARLCAFGCLQSHSFGRYSTTDFGDYLLDTWAGARTLPFTTAAERAAQAAAKGE